MQEAEDDWETDVELWVLVCPNVSQKFFDALQYKCHTLVWNFARGHPLGTEDVMADFLGRGCCMKMPPQLSARNFPSVLLSLLNKFCWCHGGGCRWKWAAKFNYLCLIIISDSQVQSPSFSWSNFFHFGCGILPLLCLLYFPSSCLLVFVFLIFFWIIVFPLFFLSPLVKHTSHWLMFSASTHRNTKKSGPGWKHFWLDGQSTICG